MDLFTNPELQYVRAAENPPTRLETYEFAIQVKLDNTRQKQSGVTDYNDQVGAG